MKKFTLFILFLNYLLILPKKNFAQLPSWLWAKGFGDAQSDYGRGITTDDSGNIYTIGSFSGNIFFDSTQLSSEGGQNIFITKMNPQGHVLWAKRAIGNWADHALAVTVDKSSNVFITGSFLSDSLTLDSSTITNTSSGSEEIFIAKLSSDGTVLWLNKAVGDYRDFPGDIKADPFGNVVVTGFYESSTIEFGDFTLTKSPGWRSIYFVKYNTNGNVLWAKSFGGDDWDLAETVAFDNIGNIYLGGGFGSSSIKFDSITLTKIPGNLFDLFIAKFNSNGEAIWAKGGGGGASEEAYKIAVDQAGSVYATGYFSSSTIILDTITLINNGDADIFVAKYDSNGNIQWAKEIGGIGKDLGQGITIDDHHQKVIISGQYESPSISFNSKTLINQGLSDIFVSEFDFSGDFMDAVGVGGTDDDLNAGIAGNEASGLILTGSFKSDTLKFESNVIFNHNAGTEDIFIAKMFSPSLQCPDVPTRGLIAYYPFDGNLNDYSGNEHNGTAIGSISYGSDHLGESNSTLNLGSGRVVTDNFFSFQRTDSFSVSVWFTLATSAGGGRLISTECPEGNFRIAAYDNGVYAIQFGASNFYIYDTVTLNTWNHIVYIYNNGKVDVYKNGVLKYSQISTDTEPLHYCAPFTIGAKASPAYDLWQGSIDNLRIYNGALDSFEARNLYNECSGVLVKNEIKLNAFQYNKKIKVNWTAASEESISSYLLQRSIDGVHFSDVLPVNAKGYINSAYEYIDSNIPATNKSTIFYRIKINDKDGTYRYSEIAKATLSSLESLITLYPNPSSDRINVTYSARIANAAAIVINNYGVIVKRIILNAGSTHSVIDISTLAKGIYFLKIFGEKDQQSIKFLKE